MYVFIDSKKDYTRPNSTHPGATIKTTGGGGGGGVSAYIVKRGKPPHRPGSLCIGYMWSSDALTHTHTHTRRLPAALKVSRQQDREIQSRTHYIPSVQI